MSTDAKFCAAWALIIGGIVFGELARLAWTHWRDRRRMRKLMAAWRKPHLDDKR